jgi:hypothetical protein
MVMGGFVGSGIRGRRLYRPGQVLIDTIHWVIAISWMDFVLMIEFD